MRMRKEGLVGLAIGGAMALALGAVSFFVKPGWAGFGRAEAGPDQEAKQPPPAVRAVPATLPEDFDEMCRAAGI